MGNSGGNFASATSDVAGGGQSGGDAGQVPAAEGVRGAGEAGAHGSGHGALLVRIYLCLF